MRKRIIITMFCLFTGIGFLHAQSLANLPNGATQIAKFFPAAAVPTPGNNVQQLVAGYISPIAEDLGALGNNGWYNTGSTHKKFGFDLSVSMNAVAANSSTKYFGINSLSGVTYNGSTDPSSPGGGKAPTAYGPETEFPRFNINTGPNNLIPFFGPSGGNVSKDVPIGSIAIPTIQAGIGLFKNTDIRIRYTPTISINDTEMKNWGIGFMHDIKQHIPGIKMAPIGLSLFLAYSQSTVTTGLGGIYQTAAGSGSYAGQQGIGDTKNYTVQVLISKTIPVLTFYGGIGYNSSTTNYSIKGSYYVDKAYTDTQLPAVPLISPTTLKDPFNLDISSSGVRFTGGIRFKFGPVFLVTDYTYVNQNNLYTLGFGFTVH